jgi:hypothetical protein
MINEDQRDQLIDEAMINFIDNYASIFGHLPDTDVVSVWQIGFIDACTALGVALRWEQDNG